MGTKEPKTKKPKIQNPSMCTPGANWNVVTGCTKYSDGCLNCFAEDTIKWLQRKKMERYLRCGFEITAHVDKLNWPLKFPKRPKQPKRSFVTDIGDLFHPEITDEFIFQVFETMLKVPQHRFYVLTKRAERLVALGPRLPWSPWIWAGVTVESDKYLFRVDHLRKLPPEVNKYLIFEPLLSDIPKLDLKGIQWVVVGGETNSRGRFRPMQESWVVNIRDQAKAAGLPFLFKHWQGKRQSEQEALLQGQKWAEYPESLVRNMEWERG